MYDSEKGRCEVVGEDIVLFCYYMLSCRSFVNMFVLIIGLTVILPSLLVIFEWEKK